MNIFNITQFEEDPSSWGSIVFLGVFLFIIFVLILVAIFGSRKDKQKKAKESKIQKGTEEKAKRSHIELYLVLSRLIHYVEDGSKNLKPAVGTDTIGTVNKTAKNILERIKNSDELKNVYQSKERKEEFKPILTELYNIKPTNWHKEAFFSRSLIIEKTKHIKKNKDLKDVVKKVDNYKWN